jgi:hypothetical protein
MSRKYGQRGYQEGDRERGAARSGAVRREPSGGTRLQPDRPRGRGLGAPGAAVFRCAACGTAQEAPPAEGAGLVATCAKCGGDLHTCTHCAHFDSGARWQCRAAISAPIAGKRARNECPLFAPRQAVEHAQESRAEPDDPRAAFDALFKL